MVSYFDTSAFVPLILEEAGSEQCRRLWGQSSAVFSTRLLFVEATAAISRSNRSTGNPSELSPLQSDLTTLLWESTSPVELTDEMMHLAAHCAWRFDLRGYDAVHCAAAASIAGDRVVAASSDRKLLEAWTDLGLATFDPLV